MGGHKRQAKAKVAAGAKPTARARAKLAARSGAGLWGERQRATRGPKPGLEVGAIARAAVAIADAEGFEAVSMQRVASELGYTTMALYRHVPDKAELVARMIETSLAPPPEFVAGAGWRANLEAWARGLWAVFHRHPWALAVSGRLRVMGPVELGWMERALAAFAGTGLSASEAHRAFLAVLGQVHSATRFALPPGAGESISGEQWSAATRALLQEHGEGFPALRAAMAAGAFAGPTADGLGFGLRCVLDGIEVLIAGRAAGPRGAG
jgi:AcrR family transcriptional regulator